MSASSTVTEIILRAAGAPLPTHENPLKRPRQRSGSCSHKQVFYRLTSEEWGAVLRVCHGRDWRKWEREAIRTALGFKNHVWTPCADAFLRLNYGRLPQESIRLALPGRSDDAIASRAVKLGLTRAPDERFVTLSVAARLTGYDETTISKMVPVTKIGLRRVFKADDVKRAAERHSNTVESVAQQLHSTHGTVRRELIAMGHSPPPRGCPWRLEPQVVKELQSRFASRPNGHKRSEIERGRAVSVVVRDLHTKWATVVRELEALGVERPSAGKTWRISDEVVVQLKERLGR